MSVRFITDSSGALLKKFNDAIDQDEPKGRINTWRKRKQGEVTYYTHVADDWAAKAFFKARKCENKLVFNIVRPEGKSVDQNVYAYYHAHLIETFTRHFPNAFTDARADPVASADDNVAPA